MIPSLGEDSIYRGIDRMSMFRQVRRNRRVVLVEVHIFERATTRLSASVCAALGQRRSLPCRRTRKGRARNAECSPATRSSACRELRLLPAFPETFLPSFQASFPDPCAHVLFQHADSSRSTNEVIIPPGNVLRSTEFIQIVNVRRSLDPAPLAGEPSLSTRSTISSGVFAHLHPEQGSHPVGRELPLQIQLALVQENVKVRLGSRLRSPGGTGT